MRHPATYEVHGGRDWGVGFVHHREHIETKAKKWVSHETTGNRGVTVTFEDTVTILRVLGSYFTSNLINEITHNHSNGSFKHNLLKTMNKMNFHNFFKNLSSR